MLFTPQLRLTVGRASLISMMNTLVLSLKELRITRLKGLKYSQNRKVTKFYEIQHIYLKLLTSSKEEPDQP